MYKKILLIFFILTVSVYADEFDLESAKGERDSKITEDKYTYYPLSDAQIAQFIPTIPRMLTKKEQMEKYYLEKAKKEKEAKQKKLIEETFADKSKLKEIKKDNIKVKVEKKEVDFFDSLENSDKEPVSME